MYLLDLVKDSWMKKSLKAAGLCCPLTVVKTRRSMVKKFSSITKDLLKGNVGGLQQKKNRKKPSSKFRICCSLRFFRHFSVFSAFFGFCGTFLGFFSTYKNEVLRGQEFPNNTSNTYGGLQKSYKSYFNQQEPLNQNPLNQSKSAKTEKPKKNEKTEKKIRKNQSQIWNLL